MPRAATADPCQDQPVAEWPAPDRDDCDSYDGQRAGVFATIATSRAGKNSRWSCAAGMLSPNAPCTRHGDRDPDRQPDVDERRRDYAPPAIKEERADPEERRREQAAEEVVDAERARVPPGGRAPGRAPPRRPRRRRARPTRRPAPAAASPASGARAAPPAAGREAPPRTRRALPRGDSLRAELGSRGLAEKRYLMTPGPTPVPPEVLAAMALPIVHHRSPDFRPTLPAVPRPPARRSTARRARSCSTRPRGRRGSSRSSRT